jgi:hypothetical protein
MNPKNYNKDSKKKNMLGKYLGNQVERNSDVDDNIVYTSM